VLGTVVSLGRPQLKNIAQRFSVYALLSEAPKGVRQRLQVQRLKFSRRIGFVPRMAIVALTLIAVTAEVVQQLSLSPPSPPALPLPDKPSVVVRRFANLSDDPEQDYFSNGIPFDITSELSKLSSLFVIASGTGQTLPLNEPIAKVGQELGVRYVLDGSVRKAGEQVRVTVQLSDAGQDHLLWSERYDRELKDIFAVQDEIREKIVLALKVKLAPEEQERFRHAPTANLDAYDYFLRGWADYQRVTKEAHARARQMFEKAIELDPQYAAAYTALGGTYWWAWAVQWTQDSRSLEQAFALAQKAVTLDESLPFAHVLLGHVYQWEKQHDKAIAEAERAVALDPNCAGCYAELGQMLNLAGRPTEAIGMVEKAMRLDPRTAVQYVAYLGRAYRLTGRYEEAVAAFKKILAVNPNLLGPHTELIFLYTELGQEAAARAEVVEVLRISPNFSVEVWGRRLPFKDPTTTERFLDSLRKAGLK
jgi:adenylate cyclase